MDFSGAGQLEEGVPASCPELNVWDKWEKGQRVDQGSQQSQPGP